VLRIVYGLEPKEISFKRLRVFLFFWSDVVSVKTFNACVCELHHFDLLGQLIILIQPTSTSKCCNDVIHPVTADMKNSYCEVQL